MMMYRLGGKQIWDGIPGCTDDTEGLADDGPQVTEWGQRRRGTWRDGGPEATEQDMEGQQIDMTKLWRERGGQREIWQCLGSSGMECLEFWEIEEAENSQTVVFGHDDDTVC